MVKWHSTFIPTLGVVFSMDVARFSLSLLSTHLHDWNNTCHNHQLHTEEIITSWNKIGIVVLDAKTHLVEIFALWMLKKHGIIKCAWTNCYGIHGCFIAFLEGNWAWARFTEKRGLIWWVGNGERIRIWRDNWIPRCHCWRLLGTRCRWRWVPMRPEVPDWDNSLREELRKEWELLTENDLQRMGLEWFVILLEKIEERA